MIKKIKKLSGSYSSEVFLVELNKKRYVFKRVNDISEVLSEKKFNKVLKKNNISFLKNYKYTGLKPNEILLEYIDNSKILGNEFNKKNCKAWGEITKKVHSIKYKECFKYDDTNKKIILKWPNYIKNQIKEAFVKAKENGNYGFNGEQLREIEKYLLPLKRIELNQYSLIHGDLHTSNILIKGNELILFDKNADIFTGDPLRDLAIALLEMPNETLVKTKNPEFKNDKECLEAFIKGYGVNFLENKNLKRYVMLIAFGRLYTPFSINYKEIILNLLKN